MKTDDFDFYLPETLIAQHPTGARNASRLLHLNNHLLNDKLFIDLPNLVNAGDLLVFNDTRVIKARLFGHKQSGGAIELLVERVLDNQHVMAHIKASRAAKAGTILKLAGAFDAEVLGRTDDLFHVEFCSQIFRFIRAHNVAGNSVNRWIRRRIAPRAHAFTRTTHNSRDSSATCTQRCRGNHHHHPCSRQHTYPDYDSYDNQPHNKFRRDQRQLLQRQRRK